jgi:hypothetical protein
MHLLASRFKAPLNHQLHFLGMPHTMVAQLLLPIQFWFIKVGGDGNLLEAVKAHLSLL